MTTIASVSELGSRADVVTRRAAVQRLALGALALAGSACRPDAPTGTGVDGVDGRLTSRPEPPFAPVATGLQPLDIGSTRDGLLFVPSTYRSDVPAPLVILFHGARQSAIDIVEPVQPLAEEMGLVLLAPDSRRATWEPAYGYYGPDTTFIDLALTKVYATVAVDGSRLRMAGFSDGASYALSLGLFNGDQFTRIAAFSPGYVSPGGRRGIPKLFITHGTADPILPIDDTSRRLVPALRTAGYDVEYIEFDGGHVIPPAALLRQATTGLSQG